ncbi:MAG: thymidylate kinase [Gammaproteobacteria bacterium SG8_11]|nr:MAG: thymidylate kinase [Gammaproteobacteria bacterium SG8_11]
MPGKFITLEGGEGAGKSTALAFIAQLIRDNDIDLVLTREPGGTPLGEQLRALLLDYRNTHMCDDTELLLMFAARSQHLAQVIEPALREGKWVLCDRFTDATYAYQGGGRGIDMQRIAQLEQWVQGERRPDLTVLLDVPVDVGMQRVSTREETQGQRDRFEREKHSFFEKVRQAYLDRARQYQNQYRIIDAAQSLSNVQQQLRDVLTVFIGENI